MSTRPPDPPWLETRRVGLRRLRRADLDFVARLYADQEIVGMIGFAPLDRRASAARLTRFIRHWRAHGFGASLVVMRGRPIGLAGVWVRGKRAQLELGYMLLPRYWGRGLTTEIAGGLVARAFDALGASAVIADIDPGNAASQRVLRKLGFRRRGRVRRAGGACLRFALSRRTWQRAARGRDRT